MNDNLAKAKKSEPVVAPVFKAEDPVVETVVVNPTNESEPVKIETPAIPMSETDPDFAPTTCAHVLDAGSIKRSDYAFQDSDVVILKKSILTDGPFTDTAFAGVEHELPGKAFIVMGRKKKGGVESYDIQRSGIYLNNIKAIHLEKADPSLRNQSF